MSSLNESVLTLLTLTESQYKTLSNDEITNLERKLAHLQREPIDQENKDMQAISGLWMSAPKNMTLNSINTFVLMSFIYSGYRSWEVFPQNNVFLIIRHKTSGRLWIGAPFKKLKRGSIHRSALGSGPDPMEAASSLNRVGPK